MIPMIPLEIKNLSFSYDEDVQILHDVEGTFYEGTFYSIVGPNGSGKTTWLKALGGIHKINKGAITMFGEDLSMMTTMDVAKRLSFVPQMFNIPYAFTVREVIMMGRYAYMRRFANPNKSDREAVSEAIRVTNLQKLENRYVNELSGGELQRVIIARAIAQDTDIIVLDEPISHLDIHYQYEIVTLLKRLCRDKKKTVIAVLHDLNVTMNHCDHIFLLKDGKIVAQGEPKVVLTKEIIHEVYGLHVEVILNKEDKWITW